MTDRGSGRPWSNADERKGAGAQVSELKDLVVGYAKQETVDPLKTLGRYLGFGIAGSLMLGTGLVLLLLALLRGLQRIEFFNDPLEVEGGTWSWLPYAITGVVGAALVGLFLMKLMSVTKKRGTR